LVLSPGSDALSVGGGSPGPETDLVTAPESGTAARATRADLPHATGPGAVPRSGGASLIERTVCATGPRVGGKYSHLAPGTFYREDYVAFMLIRSAHPSLGLLDPLTPRRP
jgi:hypothetical protein